MTHRELGICKSILEYLHDLDGGQAHELVLHKGASEHFMAMIPKNEFDTRLEHCASEGWVMCVKTRFKGALWSITPAGEKALVEMNQ